MPFLSGLLTLALALLISGVAAYFSVSGLAMLFAAAWWPVVVMGSSLEAGKLMAAAWLHANWRTPSVGFLHKAYLAVAVAALMLVTAIGIFGYLSAGYLEQTAPLGEVSIQIEQREARIIAKRAEGQRLTERQAQLDAAVNSLIAQQHVVASQKLRDSQKAERGQVAGDLAAANADIDRLASEIVPLRSKSSAVGAKLGPIKYVAALFGWSDTDSAVRLVILLLMIAFDPLAVMLVLSSAVSFEQWKQERRDGDGTPTGTHQAPDLAAVPVDVDPSFALQRRTPSGAIDFPSYYAAEANHARYQGMWRTAPQPAATQPGPADADAAQADQKASEPDAQPNDPQPAKPIGEMSRDEKLEAAHRALPPKTWLDN